MEAIRAVCHKHKLRLHLDGARLFNAIVAKGYDSAAFGQLFHTMSVCFSKGMGTPMGSVLFGSADFIRQARRVRKRWGGGWRQAGYIAAAVQYALENHIPLLSEDHRRAKAIEVYLKTRLEIEDILPVETNIVIFEVAKKQTAEKYLLKLEKVGIKAAPFGKHKIRLVTHLDFTDAHLVSLLERWKKIVC
jgi:threonine aldolase